MTCCARRHALGICSLLLLLGLVAPRAWSQSQTEAERGRAEREQELEEAIRAERDRGGDADSEPEWIEYVRAIEERVQNNWRRPPSAKPGLECVVNLSQTPRGDVIEYRIERCNGDDETVRSIEQAVRLSSPLPMPADPKLFRPNLVLTFRPEE
jgi:colicin import membrane protein